MSPKEYGKIALNDIKAWCSVCKIVAGITRLTIGSKLSFVILSA